MELGRIGGSIAGRTDVSNNLSARNRHSFAQILGIAIQMRVVVTVATGAIELVNRIAAGPAQKQLADRAVVDRINRRTERLYDVDRFVTMSKVQLVEAIAKIRHSVSRYGRRDVKIGLGR